MSSGKHVKILGKGSPSKLNDSSVVHSFLLNTIELVGMRRLMGPHVCQVELQIRKMGKEPFEDEGGVTGVVVLSTSHAAIHTWPLRPKFVFDLYSCRDFDERIVQVSLAKRFDANHMVVHDFSEALNY